MKANVENKQSYLYFKIPITTKYSGDLCEFNIKTTYVVQGREFCEKDIYNDDVCCWYITTTEESVKDKDFLKMEIEECGCVPTEEEFIKGLFLR